MYVLIPEILFAIGKQIIRNGDSENDVVKFAFSGKESLKAAKNVLYSVTTFKLYENEEFGVDWDGKCSKFNYKKLPTSLIYCIGGSVISLHIEKLINPFFQPIIDTIIEQKREGFFLLF
uniref:Uncharacterized protein n=1 Tax=Panagrolaimus davidi TaxID=227884 RepID=A0A914RA37_9BILA